MDVLFVQNLLHVPALGGANKTNRVIAQQLAARGHTCRIVAPMAAGSRPVTHAGFRQLLTEHRLSVTAESDEAIVLDDAGVEVHAVADIARLPLYATRLAQQVAPDLALVSLDQGLIMVNAAFEGVGPQRVVCVVHTLDYLPFGPAARTPSEAGTRQLRRAGGLLTVSRAAENYLREHGGMASFMHRLPVHALGPGPFPQLGDPDRGAVTLINPSWEKGIGTLLHLADRLPAAEFLAVPSWASSVEDRAALAARPNIRCMDPVVDIDELFARTRVLIMPSVWLETFGMSATEAMLRGIPVVASDIGGLPEALLGMPHLLPADAPDQWLPVVSRLLTDRDHYLEVSARSRAAATRFVTSVRFSDIEAYLHDQAEAAASPATQRDTDARMDRLSPTQRRAMVQLLARRAQAGSEPARVTQPARGLRRGS